MEDRELIVKTSAYIDRHRDEMLSLWEKIVSIESGTPDKEGVDRVGAVLKDELESAGVETTVIPMERFGNLLTGVWHKEAAGQPIVLIGHMDTVFAKGTLEKNPFRIDENGNAHGPGVLDMKAGLVIAVYILKALHEYGYGKRPIRVVFAGDEENGHRQTNAESEIRKLCAGCAAAFNFETGFIDDGLVVGRKGSCRVTLTVHGVAAHAGNDPQRGRNAILEMAHKVIEIQKLHDFEHGLFVNVGVIQGGTVANAVAASCEVGIDIRYDSFERLEETLQAIKKIAETRTVPDTTADVTWTKPSTVMPVSEKNRLIEAEWSPEAKDSGEVYPVEIVIYCYNRSGVLFDISRIFTENNIDVKSMNVRTTKQERATITVGFETHGVEQLDRLISKLKSVESVNDIERSTNG